ncbi:putative DEAD/DEAH box RNA helicase [Gaertneriomyces semiglobifer]|nr:putative DEAD/DEAH box RNA helicase [Gaertneriomyces semiglobifer]
MDIVVESTTVESTKSEKKKSKKRSRQEAAGDAEEVSAPTVDGEQKKKKKTKKTVDDDSKASEAPSQDVDEDSLKKDKKKKQKSAAPTDEWSYQQHDSLTAVDQKVIDAFFADNEVQITGDPKDLRPILEFKQAGLPDDLASALATFPKPTFIQSACWPSILSGRDLIGIAATGSGKTLAFGVPALLHIRNRRARKNIHKKKPQVLILSPTRELAMQIQEQLEKFTMEGVKSICIYGGVPKWEQKKALQQGVNIIVATPGRLIDLMEEGETAGDQVCDLTDVSYLVLDEADRMLDMGFEESIKKIMKRLPSQNRQTVMFSATWPTAIQKIAEQYLSNAAKVTVGSTDLSANINIEQRVEVVDPMAKEQRLLALLAKYHSSRKNRILIFALYKKEAARLEGLLRRNKFNVAAIHGDLNQGQRTAAIEGFKSGTCPLLIATDVAARGIDIPNVEYVINVTFPLTIEDYCHRIGRTGRAGAKGISHTFFTLHDKAHSGALVNILKQANQNVPADLLKFGTTVKKKVDPNYGAFVKDVDMSKKGKKITFGNDSDSD